MWKFIVLILLSCAFYSCGEPHFRVLTPDNQSGIYIEIRQWKGFFDPSGAFELRLTNEGNDVKNCLIIFDDKYSAQLKGLHTKEAGMIKDSVFHKATQYTLQFSHDISNLLFFQVEEDGYQPKKITLKCDEFNVSWETE
jgi:hypothetical protein